MQRPAPCMSLLLLPRVHDDGLFMSTSREPTRPDRRPKCRQDDAQIQDLWARVRVQGSKATMSRTVLIHAEKRLARERQRSEPSKPRTRHSYTTTGPLCAGTTGLAVQEVRDEREQDTGDVRIDLAHKPRVAQLGKGNCRRITDRSSCIGAAVAFCYSY